MNNKEYYRQYYSEHKEKLRLYQKAYNRKYRQKMERGNYLYMIANATKFNEDKLIIEYVGSTENMYERIKNHKSKGKIKFLENEGYKAVVVYLELPENLDSSYLKLLEQKCIDLHKPRLNAPGNSKYKTFSERKKEKISIETWINICRTLFLCKNDWKVYEM